MRTHFLTFTAVVISLTLAGAAQAQETWPNWYVGLTGQLNFVRDADVGGPGATASEVTFDNGWGVGASLGYVPRGTPLRFFHFEGEVLYQNSSTDEVTAAGVTSNASGDLRLIAYMFNAFIDVQTDTSITPYLGAGLGWADLQLDRSAGIGATADEEDNVFAYQLLAGFGYTPATLPYTQWTLGYRYLATDDPELGSATGTVDYDYTSHNLELGAKFRF